MPNITWCDLPEDVSLWPGLPLSLSGDEVMPLDYHAGRSGWLLYGRGLDKQRLTQYQSKLGAAMVIVARLVRGRLSGDSSGRFAYRPGYAPGPRSAAGCRAAGENPTPAHAGFAGDGHGFHRHPD
nr:DUF5609 domain-containing protein [Escherichia coli]